MEENNAVNEILKAVEIRGRIERLIGYAEKDKAECLGEYEREGRKENNHPMNTIKPLEKACGADRLKYMLKILYNNGMDGYGNSDDQIYQWLKESIR